MPPHRLLHPKGHSRKLTKLTDLEFRVWIQYLLSADDFGVMPRSTLLLQSDSKHLASRKSKDLERIFDVIEGVGLVRSFEHQGDRFLYQHDWQDYQKVKWPAKTARPAIPPELLKLCSVSTRLLFSVHPGAHKVPKTDERSTDGGTSPVLQSAYKEPSKNFVGTSATRETLTLTPNANASHFLKEKENADPPMDEWFNEVWAHYPPSRRTKSARAQHGFVEQMSSFQGGPLLAWELFRANLELNNASHEWRVKGMAKGMEAYICDGLWLNVYPAEAPTADRVSSSTAKTLGGAAEFIAEGRRGA